MNFIILGMGAIGSLWASLLYLKGHKIYGVCRGDHYKYIKERGLLFESFENQNHIIKINNNFQIYDEEKFGLGHLESNGEKCCIIVTCKAYDLSDVVTKYRKIIKTNKTMLLIQNGIGNEEIIKKIIPDVIIFRATTTMGSYIVNAGHIRHTGIGLTKVGIPAINKVDLKKNHTFLKKLEDIIEIFKTSGIKSEFCTDIDLILWEKIFVNVGINAPASLRNIHNGELLESEECKTQMKKAITEAWGIGKKKGIPLKENPQFYIDLTYSVAQKTSQNINSMLQDILKGKKTEIDFINGKIVCYAKEIGEEVPENTKLTKSIKELESKIRN